MPNPYLPPRTPLQDPDRSPRSSWPRTLALIAAFGLLSLMLAWVAAPLLAKSLTVLLGIDEEQPTTAFLALDLLLSFGAAFAGCLGAARLSHGRAVAAAFGVGAVGAIFYLLAVGGFSGMLRGEFPLWYEFFPSDLLAAVLASMIAVRPRHRPGPDI